MALAESDESRSNSYFRFVVAGIVASPSASQNAFRRPESPSEAGIGLSDWAPATRFATNSPYEDPLPITARTAILPQAHGAAAALFVDPKSRRTTVAQRFAALLRTNRDLHHGVAETVVRSKAQATAGNSANSPAVRQGAHAGTATASAKTGMGGLIDVALHGTPSFFNADADAIYATSVVPGMPAATATIDVRLPPAVPGNAPPTYSAGEMRVLGGRATPLNSPAEVSAFAGDVRGVVAALYGVAPNKVGSLQRLYSVITRGDPMMLDTRSYEFDSDGLISLARPSILESAELRQRVRCAFRAAAIADRSLVIAALRALVGGAALVDLLLTDELGATPSTWSGSHRAAFDAFRSTAMFAKSPRWTPAHFAARFESPCATALVFEAVFAADSAQPADTEPTATLHQLWKASDGTGVTPTHVAAKAGNATFLSALYQVAKRLACLDTPGCQPAHAARADFVAIRRSILSCGAAGHSRCVQVLGEMLRDCDRIPAVVSRDDVDHAASAAVTSHRAAALALLLDHGARVKPEDLDQTEPAILRLCRDRGVALTPHQSRVLETADD